jgi:hypothetical protein
MLGHDPFAGSNDGKQDCQRASESRAVCISEILGDRRFRNWGAAWYCLQRIDFVLRVAAVEFFLAQCRAVDRRRGLSGSHTRAVFPVMA